MAPSVWLVSVVLVLNLVEVSRGHGRLRDPPGRASLWREGYNVPANYEDNQLFCGGYEVQWVLNKGACGVCGDPWEGPHENEAGGKYAQGIIVREYDQGQVMTVSVEITAHHMGWFEFRLCPHNDPTTPVSHDCLDEHLLHLPDINGTRFHLPPPDPRVQDWYHIRVLLPQTVTCTQCVLQWKYNTGNSWGVDLVTQEGCIGCGPQEQFFGCSDIAILPKETSEVTFPTPKESINLEETVGDTTPLPVVQQTSESVSEGSIGIVEDIAVDAVTEPVTSGAAAKSNVLTTVIITSARTIGSAFPSSTTDKIHSRVKTVSPSAKKTQAINDVQSAAKSSTGTGSSFLKNLVTAGVKRHFVKTSTSVTQEYRRLTDGQLASTSTTVAPSMSAHKTSSSVSTSRSTFQTSSASDKAVHRPNESEFRSSTVSSILNRYRKPDLVHSKINPSLSTVLSMSSTTPNPRKIKIHPSPTQSDIKTKHKQSQWKQSLSSRTAPHPSVSEPTCVYMPTSIYSDTPGMADWCQLNCPSTNCDSSYCTCVVMTTTTDRCRPTTPYADLPEYVWWCSTRCETETKQCPPEVCTCE